LRQGAPASEILEERVVADRVELGPDPVKFRRASVRDPGDSSRQRRWS
jgi:hypothetical protein